MSVSGVLLNGGFSRCGGTRGKGVHDGRMMTAATAYSKANILVKYLTFHQLSEMKAIIFYVRIFRLNVPAVDKQIQIYIDCVVGRGEEERKESKGDRALERKRENNLCFAHV